jgi:hypothetical protein
MPYGRGGAGNILQATLDSARATADLEAANAHAPASSITSPDDVSLGSHPSSSSKEADSNSNSNGNSNSGRLTDGQEQYAHMGRGGAGNWYSPRELSKTGEFTSSSRGPENGEAASATATATATAGGVTSVGVREDAGRAMHSHSPIFSPAASSQQQLPTARFGRGGAGNMTWEDPAHTIAERQRREEEEARRKEEVSKNVVADVEKGLARPGRAIMGADVGVGERRRVAE